MDKKAIIGKVIQSYTRLCDATGSDKDIFLAEAIIRRTLDEVEEQFKMDKVSGLVSEPPKIKLTNEMVADEIGQIIVDRLSNALKDI